MGYSVNLRKLTFKSIIGFGRHKDLSIFMISSINDGHSYLRYVYFNYEKIDFMPEILDLIGITEQYRITKPGKVSELEWRKNNCDIRFDISKTNPDIHLENYRAKNTEKKVKLNNENKIDSKYMRNIIAINHGKIINKYK